ncbi:MAG TPA: FKBP-type peptidyl-prolyl cis-trans isomerase [Conexibacter sp.]|nr:FKBP-type peptidyl-prolyl cis-trans isomerase [Conexibacter sp.]
MKGERRFVVCCCVLVAAFVAGCGGTSQPPKARTAAQTVTPTQTAVTEQAPPPQPRSIRNRFKEPSAPGPHPGARLTRVIVKDLVRGRGAVARPGDYILADYIESNYTTGHKFMRAWGPGRSEGLYLNSYSWMQGLIIGVNGMRVGGRRTIVVPARLSDVNETDRAGNSYRENVYFDIVLRNVYPPNK